VKQAPWKINTDKRSQTKSRRQTPFLISKKKKVLERDLTLEKKIERSWERRETKAEKGCHKGEEKKPTFIQTKGKKGELRVRRRGMVNRG